MTSDIDLVDMQAKLGEEWDLVEFLTLILI
jgi:hypothetical protein